MPSIVKEKDFDHIDELINSGGGGASCGGGYNRASWSGVGEQGHSAEDLEYGGEENWAYISQNVNYDEKIQFLDEEEEDCGRQCQGSEGKEGEGGRWLVGVGWGLVTYFKKIVFFYWFLFGFFCLVKIFY